MPKMLARGVVLLLIATATLVASVEKMRFKNPNTDRILLSWDETWEVGGPNMLAFLKTDRQLTIKVTVEGTPGIAHKAILNFKCTQSSSEFSLMDLTTVTETSSEKQCTGEIPFSVRTRSADLGEYEFTLLSSTLAYTNAFTKKLELAVSVESPFGTIKSNSLFVWNLDILSQLNANQAPGKGYTRRFLTAEAIEFLKKMDMSSSPTFGSIDFIDPQMQSLIRGAPDFLRAKLNLGAVLNFDAGACESYQISRASLFVNYNSKLDERTQNLLKHFYLNIDTLKLHYSTYGLSSAMSEFFASKSPSRIGICATLSFAGQGLPYDRTYSVEQKIDVSQVSYKVQGEKSAGCQIPEGVSSEPITIFAGMDYTPLVCPIICSDPNEPYSFIHINSDHKEIIILSDHRRDWTYVDGIRISKTSNIIEFPPTTQSRHAGQYRCMAGDKQFTFNAQVITMPQFTSISSSGSELSGNLPPVIYAMEGESMAYSCTAFFNNIGSVTSKPVFYSPATTGSNKAWTTAYTLSEFNSLVGPSGDSGISLEPDFNPSVENKTLKFLMRKVPQAKTSVGVNFTHRLECSVSVSPSDANKIGMPSYSVQSGSNVFFIPRPKPASFDLTKARNCSVQGCSTASGAEFVVSLKPSLTAYLRSIGVEVVGLFKIDDVYLTDLNIINQRGVSQITFDSVTNTLALKVEPISDAKVLQELQKRKTLTPVFNLRYPKSANLARLRLMKEAYGSRDVAAGERDCRADPACFYSTDYDVGTSLQPIVMSIEFKGDSDELAANQNNWLFSSLVNAVKLFFVLLF